MAKNSVQARPHEGEEVDLARVEAMEGTVAAMKAELAELLPVLRAAVGDCPCNYEPSAFHAEFLTIEDNVIPVVAELAYRASSWRDNEPVDDLSEPESWLTFVASHQWRHPQDVTRLVESLIELGNRPVWPHDEAMAGWGFIASTLAYVASKDPAVFTDVRRAFSDLGELRKP